MSSEGPSNRDSREDRRQSTAENNQREAFQMNKKLYVGNLSFETSDAQLEELFGKAGKVESVRVMRDTDTGRGARLCVRRNGQ